VNVDGPSCNLHHNFHGYDRGHDRGHDHARVRLSSDPCLLIYLDNKKIQLKIVFSEFR
jgi:hypothetical protein